jgi:hypothetical protein
LFYVLCLFTCRRSNLGDNYKHSISTERRKTNKRKEKSQEKEEERALKLIELKVKSKLKKAGLYVITLSTS